MQLPCSFAHKIAHLHTVTALHVYLNNNLHILIITHLGLDVRGPTTSIPVKQTRRKIFEKSFLASSRARKSVTKKKKNPLVCFLQLFIPASPRQPPRSPHRENAERARWKCQPITHNYRRHLENLQNLNRKKRRRVENKLPLMLPGCQHLI